MTMTSDQDFVVADLHEILIVSYLLRPCQLPTKVLNETYNCLYTPYRSKFTTQHRAVSMRRRGVLVFKHRATDRP